MKVKHYNEQNNQVVVFFCGYMFGDWVFEDVFKQLREYHIISVESAGSGIDNVEGGSHFSTVEWLHSYLLDKNIDQYFLAGHSMGGFVAQLFTHAYPSCVRGMILLGSCAPSQFKLSHRSDALPATRALFALDQESFFKFATYNIFTSNFLSDEKEKENLRSRFLSDFPVQTVCEEQIMAISEIIKWSVEVSPSFSCPALIVVGLEDEIVPPSWSEAIKGSLVGDAEFKIVHSSHMFMYEEPAVTAEYILEWLKKQCQVCSCREET